MLDPLVTFPTAEIPLVGSTSRRGGVTRMGGIVLGGVADPVPTRARTERTPAPAVTWSLTQMKLDLGGRKDGPIREGSMPAVSLRNRDAPWAPRTSIATGTL